MAKGVFKAKKKDGSIYYRSSINRRGKKVSLGGFPDETDAMRAYREAVMIFEEDGITIDNFTSFIKSLSSSKVISLLNLRDNGMYFKTPIYLRDGYFSYYLENEGEYKFDNEDLFYYSSHTIMKRGGHLFVNDYGSQYSLISRYGIRPYGVEGKDFRFVNGDVFDYRYENILIINRYQGVSKRTQVKGNIYVVRIHINGEFNLGRFKDETTAAICYNKGADYANKAGIKKEFMKNYIEDLHSKEYKEIYDSIELPKKYLNYLKLSVKELELSSSK